MKTLSTQSIGFPKQTNCSANFLSSAANVDLDKATSNKKINTMTHLREQTLYTRKCDMIYSMEAKVGISKVEIQVKIGCGDEFWQK